MAFATVTDIKERLGESALSAEDQAQATALILDAQGVIASAASKPDSWATSLSSVPRYIHALTVTLVCRAMASPQGLLAASETLGAYSRSETYNRDPALFLTQDEALMVRRVVWGRTVDSVLLGSHFQEVVDE